MKAPRKTKAPWPLQAAREFLTRLLCSQNSWGSSTSPPPPPTHRWVPLTLTSTPPLQVRRALVGHNDLIATAIGHSGQFHGRYLFFGLDAQRFFFLSHCLHGNTSDTLGYPSSHLMLFRSILELGSLLAAHSRRGRALGRRKELGLCSPVTVPLTSHVSQQTSPSKRAAPGASQASQGNRAVTKLPPPRR